MPQHQFQIASKVYDLAELSVGGRNVGGCGEVCGGKACVGDSECVEFETGGRRGVDGVVVDGVVVDGVVVDGVVVDRGVVDGEVENRVVVERAGKKEWLKSAVCLRRNVVCWK